MRQRAAVGVVVALFVVGVAVGALGANLVNRHRVHSGGIGGIGGHGTRSMESEMVHRLDLNPEQQRQVHVIFTDAHHEILAVLNEVRPRMNGVMDRAHNRIEQILTPEQRVAFERYRLEHQQQHLRMHMPMHPGEGGAHGNPGGGAAAGDSGRSPAGQPPPATPSQSAPASPPPPGSR
jgi:Spy/CpxP family protein refolding chaperone